MGGVLRRLRIENLVLIREAELELDAGLNAITGETGAGKTILSNAIGLLLGARGDPAAIGAAAGEAYVEAEFDLPDDDALGALAELRPDGEDAAGRRAADLRRTGRTRAYAWGRSAAREDVAAAVEGLLAMSGQFEQRRLATAELPALGARRVRRERRARAGGAPRLARADRGAGRPCRDRARRHVGRGSGSTSSGRSRPTPRGSRPAGRTSCARERERLRHVTELAAGAAAALAALLREDEAGAADLVGLRRA